MAKVFIDTELWSFALKKPLPEDDAEATERHQKANAFLTNSLTNDVIYITLHQLGEIFHVLSFRGRKLPVSFSATYVNQITELENVVIIRNTAVHLKNAIKCSQESMIHVWNFLCLLPVLQQIEVIYSCDCHFNKPYFQGFKKPIQNPLSAWLPL